MARFILDVNSKGSHTMGEEQVDKILKKMSEELFDGEVFTITCIDKTTDNQFYIDDEETKYTDNKLSGKQIKNYNKILKNQGE